MDAELSNRRCASWLWLSSTRLPTPRFPNELPPRPLPAHCPASKNNTKNKQHRRDLKSGGRDRAHHAHPAEAPRDESKDRHLAAQPPPPPAPLTTLCNSEPGATRSLAEALPWQSTIPGQQTWAGNPPALPCSGARLKLRSLQGPVMTSPTHAQPSGSRPRTRAPNGNHLENGGTGNPAGLLFRRCKV